MTRPTVVVGRVREDANRRAADRWCFTVAGHAIVYVPHFYSPEQAKGGRRAFVAAARSQGLKVRNRRRKVFR